MDIKANRQNGFLVSGIFVKNLTLFWHGNNFYF